MLSTEQLSDIVALYELRKRDWNNTKPLLVTDGETTYADVLANIDKTATLFDNLGLSQGQRAVIVSSRDADVTTLFLAMLRCGITAIPVNPGSSVDEISNILAKSNAHAIFADASLCEGLRSCEVEPTFTVVPIAPPTPKSLFARFQQSRADYSGESYPELLRSLPPKEDMPSDVSDSTIAYVLFTTGTTSEPKGVEITHRSLFAHCKSMQKQYQLSSDTRWMNILPFHLADGLIQGPVFMFYVGGTCYRPMSFRLDRLGDLLDAIYKHRITHWLTVPTVISLALEFGRDYRDAFDGDDFRYVISSAGYLEPSIWQDFEDEFNTRIVNAYGLTETVCEGIFCGPDDHTRRIGAIGKPVDLEAKVVDEHGKAVESGEIGELILRGDCVMQGYLGMPEATAAVLCDGWLSTGDLVRTDEDGFYYVVGRKKSIIITGGLNVYPEEVASVLRSIPEIRDAVVFGVEDRHWGERVVACVEVMPDANLTSNFIRAAFLQRASEEISPQEVFILRSLPRGPNGKVLMSQVRQLCNSESHGKTQAKETKHHVLEVAARVFGVHASELGLHCNRENTPGWTSLAHVDLLLSVEKEFNFRMQSRDVMTIRSLGDIVDVLRARLEQ